MRETIVTLNDKDALYTQWKVATADDYIVYRVRISYKLHSTMATTFTPCDDPVLQQFKNCYDPSQRREIPLSQPCGVLYGVSVFRDETLQGYTLVLESEHRSI